MAWINSSFSNLFRCFVFRTLLKMKTYGRSYVMSHWRSSAYHLSLTGRQSVLTNSSSSSMFSAGQRFPLHSRTSKIGGIHDRLHIYPLCGVKK